MCLICNYLGELYGSDGRAVEGGNKAEKGKATTTSAVGKPSK